MGTKKPKLVRASVFRDSGKRIGALRFNHSAKGLAVNFIKASLIASTDAVGPVTFRKTSPCSLGRIAASIV